MPAEDPAAPWGADSEYGTLRDVLLCRPDHFRWLPTSSISKATLAAGLRFDHDLAMRQHAEMVDAYRDAGVNVHFLEPDPALPYQVYARDSSFMTPHGAVVTQMHQWWRRGEYAPVIRFYQEAGIPIWRMITASAVRGRRLRRDRAGQRADRLLRRAHAGAGRAAGGRVGRRPRAGRCACSRSPSTTCTST